MQGWTDWDRRRTALLLHFDEEDSGSQASQGKTDSVTGMQQRHHALKDTEQLSSGESRVLSHAPSKWRGMDVRYHEPRNDWRQCPVPVVQQFNTIYGHLQFYIWLFLHSLNMYLLNKNAPVNNSSELLPKNDLQGSKYGKQLIMRGGP